MRSLQINSHQVLLLAGGIVFGLLLAPDASSSTVHPQGEKRTIAVGEKAEIKGVVLKRDGEVVVVRDMERKDTVVLLTDDTSIKTERKGIFRGGKSFGMTSILQGLILQVEGKGDSQGRLVADSIRFKEEDLRSAITASARVNPVEETANAAAKGVAENKQNIEANKQNIEANKQGIDATNKRISQLDEWELVKTVTVYFAVNQVTLSQQARATLDEIGPKANQVSNYKVEVAGFADSTGNAEKNLELSQKRADNVVQYLTVKYKVPLRRISTPMGYGEVPFAGSSTPQERMRDRRVEIRILVNKGISG